MKSLTTAEKIAAKEYSFQSIQFIEGCALSRILVNVDETEFKKGDVIYNPGGNADYFYIIIDGVVRMEREFGSEYLSKGDFFGEEALLKMRSYMTGMHADSDCTLLIISAEDFWSIGEYINKENVQEHLYINLMLKLNQKVMAAYKKKEGPQIQKSESKHQFFGWLLSGIIPLLVFELLGLTTINSPSQVFLSVISGLSILSVFRLVPDYLAMIIAVFVFMAGGIVPPNIILSGFSSGSFILALGLFALTSVLITSGILYRMMINILLRIPRNFMSNNIFLFFSGTFLSFGVPNLFIRSEITRNFALDIVKTAGIEGNTKAASSIVFSAFSGASIFTQCLLTGSMNHFIIIAMFWGQYASEYNFLGWIQAASVPFAVIFLGYFFILFFFMHEKKQYTYDYSILAAQKKMLGSITTHEMFASFCLFFSTLATVTAQIHGILPENIVLFMLICLLTFEFINTNNFRQNIRWDLLMFLAALSGIITTGNSIGLTDWLIVEANWLIYEMQHNFSRFATFLFLSILCIRFLLPKDIIMSFFCIVFIPLAQRNGINPWVVSYIIFTASRIWFFPYQENDFQSYADAVRLKLPFKNKDIIKLQFMMNIFFTLSLIAAFYYWRYLGIII